MQRTTNFVITHPEGYELDPQFVGNAKVEYDQMKAFEGADFIYAKNWAAYTGDNYGQILSKDRDWTVSDRQMAVTNNAYLHALPACSQKYDRDGRCHRKSAVYRYPRKLPTVKSRLRWF